jgi:hypothetical protein
MRPDEELAVYRAASQGDVLASQAWRDHVEEVGPRAEVISAFWEWLLDRPNKEKE